jgi:hypothetical protein
VAPGEQVWLSGVSLAHLRANTNAIGVVAAGIAANRACVLYRWRHSHHFTYHHFEVLLDVFQWLVKNPDWGLQYTGDYTEQELLDDVGLWCRLTQLFGASAPPLATTTPTRSLRALGGLMAQGAIIACYVGSLKWVGLSTLSSELKTLTKLARPGASTARRLTLHWASFPLGSDIPGRA